MSDEILTPRTNAEAWNTGLGDNVVQSDFARTIERGLNSIASMLGITDEQIDKWTLEQLVEAAQQVVASQQKDLADADCDHATLEQSVARLFVERDAATSALAERNSEIARLEGLEADGRTKCNEALTTLAEKSNECEAYLAELAHLRIGKDEAVAALTEMKKDRDDWKYSRISKALERWHDDANKLLTAAGVPEWVEVGGLPGNSLSHRLEWLLMRRKDVSEAERAGVCDELNAMEKRHIKRLE